MFKQQGDKMATEASSYIVAMYWQIKLQSK